jgi:hypothetical protein
MKFQHYMEGHLKARLQFTFHFRGVTHSNWWRLCWTHENWEDEEKDNQEEERERENERERWKNC